MQSLIPHWHPDMYNIWISRHALNICISDGSSWLNPERLFFCILTLLKVSFLQHKDVKRKKLFCVVEKWTKYLTEFLNSTFNFNEIHSLIASLSINSYSPINTLNTPFNPLNSSINLLNTPMNLWDSPINTLNIPINLWYSLINFWDCPIHSLSSDVDPKSVHRRKTQNTI